MHAPLQPDELRAWLRLAASGGVGPEAARRLLATFGLPQQIFAAPRAALLQVLTPRQVDALLAEPPAAAALYDATAAWLAAPEAADGAERAASGARRRFLTLADADYPAALLELPDPPLALYAVGQPAALARLAQAAAPCIAIVGTRNPTPQGAQNAQAFARHFAAAGWTVASGLALGIDGAAHEGALQGAAGDGCATVAIVGTGLDRVYPARHRALAHRIAAGGLILSEYPLGTPPLAHNFPRRNRLIAALSRGTLVVEAAEPSGSLITARLAAEQGREVFAIPGSIHNPMARGCHALIRQGAKLVESAADILEEFEWRSDAAAAPSTSATPTPPADAALDEGASDPLLQALGHDATSLDTLVARTGIDAATLQARLLELELDGHVARLPGGLFSRIALA